MNSLTSIYADDSYDPRIETSQRLGQLIEEQKIPPELEQIRRLTCRGKPNCVEARNILNEIRGLLCEERSSRRFRDHTLLEIKKLICNWKKPHNCWEWIHVLEHIHWLVCSKDEEWPMQPSSSISLMRPEEYDAHIEDLAFRREKMLKNFPYLWNVSRETDALPPMRPDDYDLFETSGSVFNSEYQSDDDGDERDNRCCRCRQHILENPLGGKFGGVVCGFHRSCQKCWWGPSNDINETDKTIIPYNQGGQWDSNYGKRRREPKESKHIALVNKPRKNKHPECFGCLYKCPDHIDAPVRWNGASGTTNDPIEID